jgi:hypothetical protein
MRVYCTELRPRPAHLPVVILIIVLVLVHLGFTPNELAQLVGEVVCVMGLTYKSQALRTSLPRPPDSCR